MRKRLNKMGLVEYIYERTPGNKSIIQGHVDTLLDIMKTAITRDKYLLINRFGRFEAYPKKAREGRNPLTGEKLTLSPRNVVSFRWSRILKSQLNTH